MSLSLKFISMWISISNSCPCYNTAIINRNCLNEIIRISMLYTLFPWDCSSIGQSTALSRRKLRVRAPSVPTDPMNPSIHLSTFWGDKEQDLILSRGSLVLFSFLFRFAFLIEQIREFLLLQLVPIDGRETYVDCYNCW